MRQLIGGVFAASVSLQASFLIAAQDFGRWAMPFGVCDIRRVKPTKEVKQESNRQVGAVEQNNSLTTSGLQERTGGGRTTTEVCLYMCSHRLV